MMQWQVFSGGRTLSLRLSSEGLQLDEVSISWPQVMRIDYPSSFGLSLTLRDEAVQALGLQKEWAIGFGSTADQRAFRSGLPEAFAEAGDGDLPVVAASNSPGSTQIDPARITTLAALPGYRTVTALGLVSQLSATSGFTATMKGQDALHLVTTQLISSAAQLGANAIVGVCASPFGAGGGITSAFGGDAVGVLMLGTAVIVAPEAAESAG